MVFPCPSEDRLSVVKYDEVFPHPARQSDLLLGMEDWVCGFLPQPHSVRVNCAYVISDSVLFTAKKTLTIPC